MNEIDERFREIRGIAEECIHDKELHDLISKKTQIVVYDGFEPSGRLNIANCLMKVHNTNILTRNGCKVIFWIADLYAQLNQKYDGNLKKIQTVGKYMIEVWKAAGLNLDNVEFIWSSEEINKRANEYWPLVMDISCKFNLPRILRCTQALGRKETDTLKLSQMLYPAMQCADIFLLNVDICQMGIDQRKVNSLAREYIEFKNHHNLAKRPIILSHHMLMGLKENQIKMSKSDPESCIYMDDNEGEVNRKIKKAYCPPYDHEDAIIKNPIIDYLRYVVLPIKKVITVERQNLKSLRYELYEDLERDYLDGKIHPDDLKKCLKGEINDLIDPIREHFITGENKNLLTQIKKFKK